MSSAIYEEYQNEVYQEKNKVCTFMIELLKIHQRRHKGIVLIYSNIETKRSDF